MGIVDTLPVKRVKPVLCLPLWLGSLKDVSSTGAQFTPSGSVFWASGGSVEMLGANTVSTYISTPHNDALAVQNLTLHVFGEFLNQDPNATLIRKLGSAGRYHLYSSNSTNITLYNGTVTSSIVADWRNAKSVSVTLVNGGNPLFYIDGAYIGQGDTAITIPVTDGILYILGPSNTLWGKMSGALIYPTSLTSSEINDSHYWSRSRITPRKQWPGSGLHYPNRETQLLADGDMSAPDFADWIEQNDPIATKETIGGISGQYARIAFGGTSAPKVYQVILQPGKQYRARGWIRGDGSATGSVIALSTPIFTSSSSTDWQYFDKVFISPTGGFTFKLQTNTGVSGYADFDSIIVNENPPSYTPHTGDPLYRDNIQTARVSLANETAGQLSNTGYTIQSGTWKVEEDSGGRYIVSVVGGYLLRKNIYPYGTWEFSIEKNAGFCRSYFVTDSEQGAGNAYRLEISVNDAILLYRDGVALLTASADSYVSEGERLDFRITRSDSGEFTTYIKIDGAWILSDSSASGSNPVTNTSVVDSTYCVFYISSGSKLYLDRQYAGVISP